MTDMEKITLLEELMELEEGDLTKDSVLEEIEEWDSLTKLSLMAAVKKQFGKSLTVSELREFKTVGDICAYFG